MGKSTQAQTARGITQLNRVSLPKLWEGELPREINSYLQQSFINRLGYDKRPVIRLTDGLLNMFSNSIIPRETLLEIHNEVCLILRREITSATKVQLRLREEKPELALPDYSGKVTEEQVNGLINKIGVELEGGWDKHPNLRTKPDGSVNVEANYIGEIDMPPYRPTEFPWEVEKTGFFANYPTAVNDTCGMHVHFSFTHPSLYESCVTKEFGTWLLTGLETWGKSHRIKSQRFYDRIHSKNRYCRNMYYAMYQLGVRGSHTGERYSAVNYCLAQHGTMEIRVLPMFKSKEIARKAIVELVRLVTIWVDAQRPRDRKPVVLAVTEYDTRELPKEFHFRGPEQEKKKSGPGEVGANDSEREGEFDPVGFVISELER